MNLLEILFLNLTLSLATRVPSAAQDTLQPMLPGPQPAARTERAAGHSVTNAPQPEPAVPALLKLFSKYQVVGLADLHGCAELLAFVEQLVQQPEFSATVNDFTWEPGNARFQSVMDDFILQGREVPYLELAECWRNNTQVHTYSDTPALFHLLQTIQKSNRRLPAERRVRVLLIDPPVDWSRIKSTADLRAKDFDRESHMAEVLEREVYAKGRKALFFAGGAHLGRGGSPLQNLERKHPGTTVNIGIHDGFGDRTDELEARLVSWPKPALSFIRNTWWGDLPPPPSGDIFVGPGGAPIQPAPDRKIQDNWDAVLFLGKRRELTRVNPPGPEVLDDRWIAELKRRKAIVGGPGGIPDPSQKPQSRQFFPADPPPGDRIQRLPFNGLPPGSTKVLPPPKPDPK